MSVQKNPTALEIERKYKAIMRVLPQVRAGANAHTLELLDELDDDLGISTEPITAEGLRSGQYTAEQLIGRQDDVEAALTGKPVGGTELTLANIRAGAFSPEELAGRMDEVTALMEAGDE